MPTIRAKVLPVKSVPTLFRIAGSIRTYGPLVTSHKANFTVGVIYQEPLCCLECHFFANKNSVNATYQLTPYQLTPISVNSLLTRRENGNIFRRFPRPTNFGFDRLTLHLRSLSHV